jgi:mRNA interferase MazF
LKRGTVITVKPSTSAGDKPRPAIVVQNDDFETADTLIIVPLTSEIAGNMLVLPIILPDANNGLREPSRLMTNRLTGASRTQIGRAIGQISISDMERVDDALFAALGLGGR